MSQTLVDIDKALYQLTNIIDQKRIDGYNVDHLMQAYMRLHQGKTNLLNNTQ